jgi:hypothetical protein
MKCISIRQPFAWLVTHPGELIAANIPPKNIENREQNYRYRGAILIHAGKQFDDIAISSKGKLDLWYFRNIQKARYSQRNGERYNVAAVMPQSKEDYSTGAIIGIANLVDVTQASDSVWFCGTYGLVLANARPIDPILYSGKLGLFDVPLSIVEHAIGDLACQR